MDASARGRDATLPMTGLVRRGRAEKDGRRDDCLRCILRSIGEVPIHLQALRLLACCCWWSGTAAGGHVEVGDGVTQTVT